MDSIIVKSTGVFISLVILALIIFLVLLVVNFYVKPIFSFLPTNVVESSVAQSYANTTMYTSSPAPSDTKMTFSPNIQTLNKENFTLTFDCFLNGTYLSTTVPRVLLYFDSNPVQIANNNDLREFNGNPNDETPKLLTSDNSDLLTKFQNTNFIVYADPVKNDMKVGVFTVDSNDSTKKYLEIASVIPNIPINQPFQITLVVGRTFIEVYKNKSLVNTYTIGSEAPKKTVDSTLVNTTILNTSSIPSSDYGIFTPTSYIKDTIKIGNIQIYNGVLTSGQIRNLTPTLRSNTFFS